LGGEEESDSLSFLEALEEKADNLRYYIKLSGVSEIARRYFVMNAFDGAVTMLGVLIGAIIGGGLSPKIILATGLGAGIAMGVSGFFGAYLAEEAERTRRIKQLERALHIDLDDSVIERAARVAAIMAAFIDALSPVMATIVTLIPIILAVFGIIEAWTAIITSIATILVLLTILGLFLGKISGERILYYSIATTCAGLVTGLLGLLLHVLFSL